MSYNGIRDADLDLKLKVMNFLWHQGYISRPCIKLYHYVGGERTSKTFTDIDVLGIKFDTSNKPIKLVCSAKSGRESDPQQIFILAGIKLYFNAQHAIYIRDKASILGVSELSKKLDIQSFNTNELVRMGMNIGVDFDNIRYINSKDNYIITYDLFRQLKKELPHVYNYISERYWIDLPNYSTLRSITCINELNESKLNDNVKLFFIFYCISLFLISIIQIINKLNPIPNTLFITALETELLGGEYSETEKKKIIEKITSLMTQYTKYLLTKVTIPLDKIADFSHLLEIPNFNEISNLIIRLREKSYILQYVPQIFDVIIFEIVQKRLTEIDQNILYTTREFTKKEKIDLGKIIKDTLIFFERIKIFNRDQIKIFIDNL